MSLKVAVIGAGSLGFTRRLMMDILAVPEFRETEFRFMDIDADRNVKVGEICRKMIADSRLPAKLTMTTDRRRALDGADYVFCVVRVGGLEAFAKDVEIPLKYGVDQCVGDTLCAGGIFYAQRTIPVLLDICKDMRQLCPGAMLINHTNPMAMNSWAVYKAGGVRYVGLCHGVEGGVGRIAAAFAVEPKDVEYICAGINHQTWYIKVKVKGRDVTREMLRRFEAHPRLSRQEPVRIDVLRRFGYFSTESNGHLSEYVAWYRKGKNWKRRWVCKDSWILGPTKGYLDHCRKTADYFEENYRKWLSGELPAIAYGTRSSEHGSWIMEAQETGRPYRGYFNVMNNGIIDNLPAECCVEVPGYVDRFGVQPLKVGPLPPQCAAVCKQTILVQELAVEAALTGNKDLVRQAVALDPLCGAVLTTQQVWDMCDEMFKALGKHMPQFKGRK